MQMYKVLKTEGRAKRAEFNTPHGTVQTPVFMNVGTCAAIKGALSSEDLERVKCQIELSNTYHLHVRPGDQVIKDLGGLRKFMSWSGPILTDSGGFQVFSLSSLRQISEDGVTFASHVDGRKIFMGPEESIEIQSNLGSTIAMAFDECAHALSTREYIQASVARTSRWLTRCLARIQELNNQSHTLNKKQMLFGINQGGIFEDIRQNHAEELAKMDLDGYAIGGLAVGETAEKMYQILEAVTPILPNNKPTYLMGVGTPSNILEAVSRGVDFFDCVLPARNGRHGHVYTKKGKLNMLNAQYERDDLPIDTDCDCPVCLRHTRAYVRHLFKAKEMLAMRLCVMHNLYYYNTLMNDIRVALDENRFEKFKIDTLTDFKS